MFLIYKQIKRAFALILFIAAIYTCFALFHGEDLASNEYKIEVIEDAIKSTENQVECRIPDIPVNSPEMMSFIKSVPPIECDQQEPWVKCGIDENKPWICSIQSSIVDRFGMVTCDFIPIFRGDNDYVINQSKRVRSKRHFQMVDTDFVGVKCWTDEFLNRKYWRGLLTGIRKRVIENKRKRKIDEMPFNVIMFGLDSMSRNAFIRKLPKTYEYLSKKLGSDVLHGYNIVGDGTPQALIPLLTGSTELELPETRKRIKQSQPVNVYPFIFNEYKNNGYVTAFNEDLPNVGTFTYRLNGFEKQPTDHYMRPFYLAFELESNRHQKLCIGDVPRHNVMLDYTTKIMKSHRYLRPQFVFSFHGELSHDSINLVGTADDDIKNWLESLHIGGLLDRTILIIMSDHGNRFADVRKTLQGKQEERLPFFSFTFPESFKQKYIKEYEQFKLNIDKLTTPFDIHATFVDLLNIQNGNKQDAHISNSGKRSRAISLFRSIPKTRSCADAYIEPHWCSCLNLKLINKTDALAEQAANAIVNRINAYTSSEREICHSLSLSSIVWAGNLVPHQTLLQFKQNSDLDGFLADLSSTTKITNDLYQLQITVLPGESIFEASLMYNRTNDRFSVNITDISRINVYGNQAHCIMEKNPDLRKFCYCK